MIVPYQLSDLCKIKFCIAYLKIHKSVLVKEVKTKVLELGKIHQAFLLKNDPSERNTRAKHSAKSKALRMVHLENDQAFICCSVYLCAGGRRCGGCWQREGQAGNEFSFLGIFPLWGGGKERKQQGAVFQ